MYGAPQNMVGPALSISSSCPRKVVSATKEKCLDFHFGLGATAIVDAMTFPSGCESRSENGSENENENHSHYHSQWRSRSDFETKVL